MRNSELLVVGHEQSQEGVKTDTPFRSIIGVSPTEKPKKVCNGLYHDPIRDPTAR